jgi:hypothetical protein
VRAGLAVRVALDVAHLLRAVGATQRLSNKADLRLHARAHDDTRRAALGHVGGRIGHVDAVSDAHVDLAAVGAAEGQRGVLGHGHRLAGQEG